MYQLCERIDLENSLNYQAVLEIFFKANELIVKSKKFVSIVLVIKKNLLFLCPRPRNLIMSLSLPVAIICSH